MDKKILKFVDEKLDLGKKIAFIMLTKSSGSTPRKKGSLMAIDEDYNMIGSVGGGSLEANVIKQAKEAIKLGEDSEFEYVLEEDKILKMACGGDASGYIKIFKPKKKLVIVGLGHVGYEIYKMATNLDFHLTLIEDRKEFVSNDRVKDADEILIGDIKKSLKNYNINKDTYVVIVTRGHKFDEIALEEVIYKNPAYIGVIGSQKKTTKIMNNLIDKGIDKNELKKVYSPIGIDMGSQMPNEIALGILAEILIIKNNGSLDHMKNIKSINL